MDIKKIIGVMLAVVALVVAATPAFAQTSTETQLEVKDIALSATEFETGTTISGTFVLVNSGAAAQVHYRVALMGGYVDGVPSNTYALALAGPVTLKSGESKSIPFSTVIPAGLIGNNLGIHIEAETMGGAVVSADEKITVTGFERFVTLDASSILVNGEEADSETTITRDAEILFNATLDNQSVGRYFVTPKASLYKDSLTGKPVKAIDGTVLELAPESSRDLGLKLPVLEKGDYILRVQFIDETGASISAEAIHSFSVNDDLVSINKITSTKTSVAAGENVDLVVAYNVSEAALEGENMNLKIELFNEQQKSIGFATTLISLGTTSATTSVTVSAKEAAQAMRAEATVTHYDSVIHMYKTNLSSNFDALAKNLAPVGEGGSSGTTLAVIVLIAAAVLILGISLIALKKRSMGLMIVLLGIMSLSFGLGSSEVNAQSGGLHTGYCGNIINGTISSKNQLNSALNNQHITISDPVFTNAGTGVVRARVDITNKTDCKFQTSFGSYRMFDMYVYNQEYYSASSPTTVVKQSNAVKGTVTSVYVNLPSTCNSQFDLFLNTSAPSNPGEASSQNAAFAAWVRNSSGELFSSTKSSPFNITMDLSGPNGSLKLINSRLENSPMCVRIPGVPTNVAATAVCGGKITVSWTAPATNASQGAPTGYYIYRDNVQIGTVQGGNSTNFQDTSAGYTAHTYRVAAFNSGGVSAQSNISNQVTSTVCPPNNPPTGIVATPQACSSGAIKVTWNTVTGATSYRVYDTDFVTPIASNLTSGTYTHSGLTAGSSHSYKVEAVNSGSSVMSNPAVSATAPANCSISGQIQALPSGGPQSAMSAVKLRVYNVSSSAVGNYTYKFFCTKPGNPVTATADATVTTTATDYTTGGICNYSSAAGTYTASVYITRGSASTHPDTTVNVSTSIQAPTVTLIANPTSVNDADSSQLTWTTTNNPTTCTASNNRGLSGWTGSKATTGGTETTAPLTADTTFTIVCSNSAGSDTESVTVSVANPGTSVSCQPEDPLHPGEVISQAQVGSPVKWVATGGGNGNYSWTGSDGLSASGYNRRSVIKTYTTIGNKTAFVEFNNNGSQTPCDYSPLKISTEPGYKQF